jgi:hypothetical protein
VRELLEAVGMGGIDPDAYPAQFSAGSASAAWAFS